jgi:predicted TIM-barrel fold metal-dependent hydrolase
MGEGMPLLLYRFDWMQSNADGRPNLRGGQPPVKLKNKVSHYFKHNIWITTSGVASEPAVKFCQEVLGADRVIYAMDYPYQISKDEVDTYDRMNMSATHKKMLMQSNAEAVFRLK